MQLKLTPFVPDPFNPPLTQRQVAEVLGLRTGVAVSCQLRKLSEQLKRDKKLKHIIEQIRKKMMP